MITMMIINKSMFMRITNNINTAQSGMAKNMLRLSTGQRINSAADDPAGLAISEKMRAQIRGLNQAARNAQDSISMLQVAEGALGETHSILQRMRELAIQASNGTVAQSDRQAIQAEIGQLLKEVTRIGDTTEFNTKKLINGSAGLQGTTSHSNVTIVGGSGDTKATGVLLQLDSVEAAKGASITLSALGADGDINAGNIMINGVTMSVKDTGNISTDRTALIDSINNVTDMTGVKATLNGSDVVLTTTEVGGNAKLEVRGLNNVFSNSVTANGTTVTTSANSMAFGTNATAQFDSDASDDTVDANSGASLISSGNIITVFGGAYDGLNIKIDKNMTMTDDVQIRVTQNNSMFLQIGANEGQGMSVYIGDMRAQALRIEGIDVTTTEGAKNAITTLDSAITGVSTERARMGAYQNRLEHTINNLNTTAENLTAAESRIRDADMAKEMMEYVKNSLLAQVGQAMLAQAVQTSREGVMALLKSLN